MADEEFVDPLIGAKLGPCRVEERLAAGGMGVVYRARHTLLDQDVAVKILAPSLAADQEYVTRFFREAGAAGADPQHAVALGMEGEDGVIRRRAGLVGAVLDAAEARLGAAQ